MTVAQPGHVPRTDVEWSDPAFARVARIVHLVAGLVFPPNRRASAESGMRRAMTAVGIADAAALAGAVERPGGVRDAVLAELTVGETYFFREPAQLDALRTHVLPAMRDARPSHAPLRVWSAGCASGEEPYTLAILLRELGWARTARILGTDVSRPRLDSARRGRYTRWSMRGASPDRVARWFTPRGAHFQVAPEIQSSVEFAALNLIADEYPSATSGTADQDVVFCRNVLIYFDMDSVALIAGRLLQALAPDGWLFLGASDPLLVGLVPCEAITLAGGIAYRRADDRASSTAQPAAPAQLNRTAPGRQILDPLESLAWTATPDGAPHAPRSAVPPVGRTNDPALRTPAQDPPSDSPAAPRVAEGPDVAGASGDVDVWIARVRSAADAGQLREAETICVQALDGFRLSAELHYLHAMLLSAAGRELEATKAARRALYLDHHFVMAHLLLGESLARVGDVARASRAFEAALTDLADVSDTVDILAADGMPASGLRRIAERRLAGLRGGSS